ncbi:SDR family NAD(P)-dependent oxidoreductase [Steroidobacter agaridevorans]|uniref:SDR family NAD(P)-dependent oxidoreductase n=1 Tax=Steroidobacter agaridevorans TaxID=2695856 RepID=UPI00137B5DB9|nr:SDR family NAD(P)-dependent oxidoreductase [Steroidobacter agaridevorans]
MRPGLLEGRVALITGAARGIGRAIAMEAAAEGADVLVTDRDAAGVNATAADIAALGRKSRAVVGSLAAADFPAVLAAAAQETFGRLDTLVNNAGIAYRGSVAEHERAAWDKVMLINLTAPFLLVQATLPLLEASGRGSIVNISSTAVTGFAGQVAYDSSKGGLLSMTRSMAVDLGSKKIRANAVCPGFIATDMVAADPDFVKLGERVARGLPVSRMGKPEDVAAAVVWLASDKASYVTGQGMFIDGGWIRA